MKNKFRRLPGELPTAINTLWLPAENDDALKIGKHNGCRAIHSADERSGLQRRDGSEAFQSLRKMPGNRLLPVRAACTAIIRLMKILLSIPTSLSRYYTRPLPVEAMVLNLRRFRK